MTTQSNHETELAEQPPRRKTGAPRGNRNSMRHGLRGGSLPDGCSYVVASIGEFKKALEDAILADRGEVSIIDAALVSTCCRWETHALLAQRWLRTEFANLTAEQRLSYSQAIAAASEKRDKALAGLNLNRAVDDLLGRIAVFEPATPKITTPEGLADSSHLASPEMSANANQRDSLSDPAETREKIKQGHSSQDAGEEVSGNCDSSQEAFTREDRGH